MASDPNAYGYADLNVGDLLASDQRAYGYADLNIGEALVSDRRGYGYVDLGDVDQGVPHPHIWFLRPASGKTGHAFTVYGRFGANVGGAVKLAGLACGISSWQQVADTHTTDPDPDRKIEPGSGTVTFEHDQIEVSVPAGAESGLVTVETDA